MRCVRFARFGLISLLFLAGAGVRVVLAQTMTAQQAAVKAVLIKQQEDWNKGDLQAFEAGYKNSPDIVFMGSTVRRGYAGMAEGYRKAFATAEQRGVLDFSGLEVHVLDARFATVIGRFHLLRTAAGGGDTGGPFSLVLEKTAAGWKIILDHTAVDTQPMPNPPAPSTPPAP